MTNEKDMSSVMPGVGASEVDHNEAGAVACADASEPHKIEDVLASEGFYMGPPAGVSMWPMLRNRHDVMLVTPSEGELHRYDVALYRRGEKYVLHRVVGRYERGSEKGYVICGDNCVMLEYIPSGNVLGVLCGFYRDNHYTDCETSRGYHAYSRLWVALFPVRKACKRASAAIRRVGKRVLVACGLRDRSATGKVGRK